MKKILLSLLLIPVVGISQVQFAFGFDGSTAAMIAAGWVNTNQSAPSTTNTWNNSNFTVPLSTPIFGSPNVNTLPNGQTGGANSFALVNFNSTTGAGTISNWLITPNITVQNGDVVTFFARKGTNGTQDFPDRLELRMSSIATVLPSAGATDVGSFTTLGVSVNPTLVAGFVFPQTWTQYTYTVSGLAAPTAVRFGFRYFVTDGGPSGANSDIIGIDTFQVNRPLSTNDFFANNFNIYPNPSSDVVTLSSNNSTAINAVEMTDINGRVVKSLAANTTSFSVRDLSSGVYFIKVTTAEGVGTTKFVRQ